MKVKKVLPWLIIWIVGFFVFEMVQVLAKLENVLFFYHYLIFFFCFVLLFYGLKAAPRVLILIKTIHIVKKNKVNTKLRLFSLFVNTDKSSAEIYVAPHFHRKKQIRIVSDSQYEVLYAKRIGGLIDRPAYQCTRAYNYKIYNESVYHEETRKFPAIKNQGDHPFNRIVLFSHINENYQYAIGSGTQIISPGDIVFDMTIVDFSNLDQTIKQLKEQSEK